MILLTSSLFKFTTILVIISTASAFINKIEPITDESKMNMLQMVKFHKYQIIQYKVTTKDGYILTMFRIPASRNIDITHGLREAKKKKSILLIHGILSDTSSFVINGPEKPNKAIAYQLADEGNYDVWLLNTRGSIYSREHSWMDPDSDE